MNENLQVQNINDRFANLKIIRNNNWQEIIPEKKKISPKKIKIVKKKKVEASSSLKNMIRGNNLTRIDLFYNLLFYYFAVAL